MRKGVILLIFLFIFSATFKINAYSGEQHNGKLGSHRKAVYAAIKKKLNINDIDIKTAKEKGRTAFELAHEKGVKDDELRKFIIEEANKSLDEVRSKGIMPRFVENKIKNKVRISIENWDGYFN